MTLPRGRDKTACMDPLAAAFDRWRRHGDLTSLGEVFDALAPRLLPIALHLCGRSSDAEDALQQTFVLAMDRAATFDASQRCEPWLAGLLHNVVRNQSRRLARRRAEPLPECAADELGPLDRAELAELATRLRTHVDALPADQRQVLRLVLQHGMSAVAIAEVLEVPPGTVRMRIHRGLEALRRVLPAGLAVTLLASLPSRGLAAVRHEVLATGAAKAAAAAAAVAAGAGTAGTGVVIGGVLVTKKVLLAVLLAGLVSAFWWLVGVPPLAGSESHQAPQQSPMPVAADTPTEIPGSGATSALRSDAMPVGARAAVPGPTELWGRVVDGATQAPVIGAAIELLRCDADAFWNLDLVYAEAMATLGRVISDGDGRFRFCVARGAPHRLRVQAAGYANRTVVQCNGGSDVTIALQRGSVVTGTVRCDGKPVVDANVRIAVWGESVELARGTTDSGGFFQLGGLPAAKVYLQVSSARHAELWRELDIAAGGQQNVEIELVAGSVVRGRIVDAADGAPIQGAAVADSWTMRRLARTDADGRFELAGVKIDRATMLHVAASGYASATERLASDVGADFELRLHRGAAVRGRVVGGDGSVVAGAYVAVAARYSLVDGVVESDWIAARVEADGTFAVAGLRGELHYWLMARAPGRGTIVRALARRLADGERLDVGEVALPAEAFVDGTVRDDKGAPIADVGVEIDGLDDGARAWLPDGATVHEVHQFRSRETRTDARGRYAFAGLAAGSYRVIARPDGFEDGVEVSVTVAAGASREGVDLVVAVGLELSGWLVAADGRPIAERIHLEAQGQDDPSSSASAVVGPDGRFRFVGLRAGRYVVAMLPNVAKQVLAPVRDIQAGRADLRLVLESPAIVSGTVLDAGGKPARAAVAAWLEGLPYGLASATSGADGTFRLEVPASFLGKVTASVEGQPFSGVTVEGVAAGRTDLVLKLR